jgi:uncharacterized protein (TIGR03067 family)
MKLMLMVVAGMLVADDKSKDEKVKKDQDAIQGTWRIASMEQGGQKRVLPESVELLFIVSGENYTLKQTGEVQEEGSLKLDSEKNPKTIDFKITKGNDHGKNQKGIYALDGDKLRLCVAPPAADDRPKELSAKEGTDHVLFELKREKK